jgi:hypothetical protein
MTRGELRDLLQPPGLRKDHESYVQFNEVLNLARSGELVEDDGGNVKLQMEAEELASSDIFRKSSGQKDSCPPGAHILPLYCLVPAAWYISLYTEKSQTLMQEFDRELNQGKDKNVYSDTNITAWRTWAAFLGYGFIHGQVLVPNTFVRLSDAA